MLILLSGYFGDFSKGLFNVLQSSMTLIGYLAVFSLFKIIISLRLKLLVTLASVKLLLNHITESFLHILYVLISDLLSVGSCVVVSIHHCELDLFDCL